MRLLPLPYYLMWHYINFFVFLTSTWKILLIEIYKTNHFLELSFRNKSQNMTFPFFDLNVIDLSDEAVSFKFNHKIPVDIRFYF